MKKNFLKIIAKEKILKERQNMREIIILKKIPRLNSKSVCAETLDSFLALALRPFTINARHETCGNKLKKLFNNCRRWWSVPGTNSFYREKNADMKSARRQWMQWSGSEYTANNYNIRRGLLTGFVIYQVRGSFSKEQTRRRKACGMKNGGIRDKTIVMKIKKGISRWTKKRSN